MEKTSPSKSANVAQSSTQNAGQGNSSQNSNVKSNQKEFNLRTFFNKLHNPEPTTFGNYHVNFNDMFKKEDQYKNYLRTHVSLFNDDLVKREIYVDNGENKSFTLRNR